MELDIQRLIESIGLSVSQAQQTIEDHSLDRFFDYFNGGGIPAGDTNGSAESEQGTSPQFKPKTVKISMPCQNDISKNEMSDVPLVTLTQHRQVHLDKVTVKIRTKLQSDENGSVTADMAAPILNDCSSPDKPIDNVYDEINLTFNIDDHSEGLSRVIQNITKTI